MDPQKLIGEFHHMLASFNATRFTNEVGDFYQGESAVLSCIAAMEDRGAVPTPSEISDRLHVARGTVTATLRALERKGLAGRETMPDNRRRVRVWLTESGRTHVQRKVAEVNDWCLRMINTMGEEEFSLLLQMLNKAITAWAVGGRSL